VYKGVEKPESIADHMYRMAVLAMTVAGTEYDQSRAIVHDLAEAIVGDITPADGVSDQEKYSKEFAALKEIQTMIGVDTAVAQEVGELWCVHRCLCMSTAIVPFWEWRDPQVATFSLGTGHNMLVHCAQLPQAENGLPLVIAGKNMNKDRRMKQSFVKISIKSKWFSRHLSTKAAKESTCRSSLTLLLANGGLLMGASLILRSSS
jgi:hypothetical protein